MLVTDVVRECSHDDSQAKLLCSDEYLEEAEHGNYGRYVPKHMQNTAETTP